MHSVSQKGLNVNIAQHLSLKIFKPKYVISCFGEIDCRVFLGVNPQMRVQTWVDDYFAQIANFMSRYRIREAIAMAPLPPSDFGLDNLQFPKHGRLNDRNQGRKWLVSAMNESSKRSTANVCVMDPSLLLENEREELDERFTDDGVHVNQRGQIIVRKHLRSLIS